MNVFDVYCVGFILGIGACALWCELDPRPHDLSIGTFVGIGLLWPLILPLCVGASIGLMIKAPWRNNSSAKPAPDAANGMTP